MSLSKKHSSIAVKTDPTQHATEGHMIFPVYSRRIGGISVGINLFPEKKICNFDCPYCEVYPPAHPQKFSLSTLQSQLSDFFDHTPQLTVKNYPIKSITFSGDGEPTLSPEFLPTLLWISDFLKQRRLENHLSLVLITNATQLLNPKIHPLLTQKANSKNLHIWAKLDAGTQDWYQKMNQTHVPFGTIQKNIFTFAQTAPLTLQTMVVALHGRLPPLTEYDAYSALIQQGLTQGAQINEIHLYTQSRRPTYPYSTPVTDHFLATVVERIRNHLGTSLLIKAFGPKARVV